MIARLGADRNRRQVRLGTVLLVLSLGCAANDCVQLPCVLPLALELTVRDAGSAAPLSATVHVSSPIETTIGCDGACAIPGPPGTYRFEVSAPGYATTNQTIEIAGTAARSCGCATTQPKQLSLTLQPAGG